MSPKCNLCKEQEVIVLIKLFDELDGSKYCLKCAGAMESVAKDSGKSIIELRMLNGGKMVELPKPDPKDFKGKVSVV